MDHDPLSIDALAKPRAERVRCEGVDVAVEDLLELMLERHQVGEAQPRSRRGPRHHVHIAVRREIRANGGAEEAKLGQTETLREPPQRATAREPQRRMRTTQGAGASASTEPEAVREGPRDAADQDLGAGRPLAELGLIEEPTNEVVVLELFHSKLRPQKPYGLKAPQTLFRRRALTEHDHQPAVLEARALDAGGGPDAGGEDLLSGQVVTRQAQQVAAQIARIQVVS